MIKARACAVYVITCETTGKHYVGSSADVKKRLGRHRGDLRANKHHSVHLQRAWDIYGEASFVFAVVERVVDRKDLLQREQKWMDAYQSADRTRGYNMHASARGAFGHKFSDEVRQKMSLQRKGKKLPDHVKAKMGLKGSAHSQAVLNEASVLRIKLALQAGASQASLAAELGVARTTINDIVAERSWAHVKVEGLIPRGRVSTTSCRLTVAQVLRIKNDLKVRARGATTKLAKEFGVSFSTIADIQKGRTWPNV